MFSATVAQKPTMPVSDGIKKRINSALVWNLLGVLSTGPRPPALPVTHHKSSRPTANRNGAPTPSSQRMVSMPFHTTHILISQKKKKHSQMPPAAPAVAGHMILSIE